MSWATTVSLIAANQMECVQCGTEPAMAPPPPKHPAVSTSISIIDLKFVMQNDKIKKFSVSQKCQIILRSACLYNVGRCLSVAICIIGGF